MNNGLDSRIPLWPARFSTPSPCHRGPLQWLRLAATHNPHSPNSDKNGEDSEGFHDCGDHEVRCRPEQKDPDRRIQDIYDSSGCDQFVEPSDLGRSEHGHQLGRFRPNHRLCKRCLSAYDHDRHAVRFLTTALPRHLACNEPWFLLLALGPKTIIGTDGRSPLDYPIVRCFGSGTSVGDRYWVDVAALAQRLE